MKIAIIGSGIAGFEAARTARALSSEAEIVLYSREAVRPYRRPALSRMVAEEIPDEQFYIKPQNFYEENRIRLELGHTLTALDPDARRLNFDNGRNERYDKLLLATGSHCFLPPVPGMKGSGVISLREYADLERLRARIGAGVKRAVVIGGGLLGLELAQSLLERGSEVTVIESVPTLLPRNLDEEAATAVKAILRKVEKLTLLFGCSVNSIFGESGGETGVELPGRTLLADLILVSAGTRANIAEAAAAGLKCNRGIVTDRQMKTSAPDIFAAGDCAEVEGVSYGLYEAARMMGAAAARNMLGETEAFVPKVYPARLSVFGIKIFSAGTLSGVRNVVEHNPEAGVFRKLFYSESGALSGCILVGDLRDALKLQSQILVS